MIAYTQSLLVDARKLSEARNQNDVVMAQEILQSAFRMDVRPIVAEARLQQGGALHPIGLFRDKKIRKQLIRQRGEKTVASGL